jgi:hypothetical protein
MMTTETLFTICRWLTLGGAFLTLVGGIGQYYFGRIVEGEKEDNYKKELVAVRDANQALEATVSQQRTELGAAGEKVARLERESAVIRSLGADSEVNFQGKWKDKPFPAQLLSPIDREFYVYLLNSAKPKEIIKLHPTEHYELKEIAAGKGVFRAKQIVRVGEFPLGSSFDELRAFDTMGIHLPFILYDQFLEPKVTVDAVKLRFIVNGQALDPVSLEPRIEIPVRFVNNDRSIAWASHRWTARIPLSESKK